MYQEEPQKSFLEELQSLDEPVKRRILVVSAIIIMAIVIYVWLGYFNGLVATNQPQQTSGSGSSFWRNMTGDMADMINFFRGPRQYVVQPN
jgi:hypothetical protein